MQVDTSLNMNNKWATAGRVPPLDLSAVTVCPSNTNNGGRDGKPLSRWQQNHSHHHHHHHHQSNLSPSSSDESIDQQQQQQQSQHHHHHMQQQQQQLRHHQHPQTHLFGDMSAIDLVHGADGLPLDPRDWTRTDVWSWLTNLAMSEGLQPTGDLVNKFPMNGKALCLMSLDMYLTRVPHGGKMLFRDFRLRLARAMNL